MLPELDYRKDIWRTIVICPNCREDNAPTFRFCGMCGTSLEARRVPGAPLDPLTAFPATTPSAPHPMRPPVVESAPKAASNWTPPISGPSMLGLNQPGPSTDALREKAFSGLDSFLEPERPKSGGRRILLMLALLAALGASGWWTYTNLGMPARGRAKPTPSSAGEDSAEKSATPTVAKPTIRDGAPTADAGSQQAAPSTAVPAGPSENAEASPDSGPKSDKAVTGKPVEQSKPAIPRVALGDKSAEKREPVAVSAKASKMPAPAEVDAGDAAFRKGEAYLYGRGVPENCNDAVQYLKAASAKSNAKARSAFGTMYATGHCVARDLPTSYLWFAMALRVDPNNQILEKDLSAVWNQMTPPERQMATRMKQ
jgi:hypothetical protein